MSNSDLMKSILKKRILITFFYLFLIRVGMTIPLPGIDSFSLGKYLENDKSFFSFFNILSGGGFSSIGFFALNIFPAINASILLEFIVPLFPNLNKLRKEEGEEGEKKLSIFKKILTLIIAFFQSIGVVSFLKPFIFEFNFFYLFFIVSTLVTGSIIVLWISDIITEKGIANGSSLIIFINILGNAQKLSLLSSFFNKEILGGKIFIGLTFLILITLIITIQDTTREVPIVSAQQLTGEAMPYFSKQAGNIPLKLNQSGVLPIIFASSIFLLPSYFGSNEYSEIFIKKILPVMYYFLIIFFSYLYSTFAWDTKKISEDLQKVSSSIAGIRPGIQTEKYLENILFRVSLIGGICLCFVMIFPLFIQFLFNSKIQTLNITSLIILVGVCLEIEKNIKTLVLSNLIKEKKGENNENSTVS